MMETLNTYGMAYRTNGSNAAAVTAIDNLDSDADGYTNREEILAGRFPGDADDHPGLVAAPYRIYTKAQLTALGSHTQFMLMNTSRSGDFYAQNTEVVFKDLLDDAGVLSTATGIRVYAPDGWSQYHPMEYDADSDATADGTISDPGGMVVPQDSGSDGSGGGSGGCFISILSRF